MLQKSYKNKTSGKTSLLPTNKTEQNFTAENFQTFLNKMKFAKKMNKKLDKIRIILAILLIASTIFSIAYTSLERNHNCSGHDCIICFVIHIAEQNIKLLSLILALKVTI